MNDTFVARGQTANVVFVFLKDSSVTTGAGLTGLTNASSGLKIALRREKSAAFTTYTGANIGGITTLGTWVNPGAGKVNFKECDSSAVPGLYELHFENELFDDSDTSRKLIGFISGVTNMAPTPFEIPLTTVNPQAINFGMDAIPPFSAGEDNGLMINGANAGLVSFQSIRITSGLEFVCLSPLDDVTQVDVIDLIGNNLDAAVSTRAAALHALNDLVWTSTRAGKLDNLSGDAFARIGAPVGASISADVAALQTAINNLNNLSALAIMYGPGQMEIPTSGSIAYAFTLLVKDTEGHLLDLTASPTITAANAAGTDRSSNLSAVSHPGTGQYTFTYTVQSSAVQEGVSIKGTGTAVSDGTSRVAYFSTAAVSTDTGAAITAIKAKTDQLTFTVANVVDANAKRLADSTTTVTQLASIVSGTSTVKATDGSGSALSTALQLTAVERLVESR